MRGRRETMKKFESLGSSVVSWMRSRGLFQQPDLTAEQVFQLEECFHIFDVDESGTVDIEEIMAAMQLLGLPAKRTVRYTHAYTHMRNCMCPISILHNTSCIAAAVRDCAMQMRIQTQCTCTPNMCVHTHTHTERERERARRVHSHILIVTYWSNLSLSLSNLLSCTRIAHNGTLRIRMCPQVVQKQMEKLQRGNRDACSAAEMDLDFEDFVELMTTFFVSREATMTSGKGGGGGGGGGGTMRSAGGLSKDDQVDFNLLAQALRRRNILDAVMTDPTKSISRYQLVAGRAGRKEHLLDHQQHDAVVAHGVDANANDETGSFSNTTPRRDAKLAYHHHHHHLDADNQATPSSSVSASVAQRTLDLSTVARANPAGRTENGKERKYTKAAKTLTWERSEGQSRPVVGGGVPRAAASDAHTNDKRHHRPDPASCRPMPALLESSIGTLETHLDAMTRTHRSGPDGFVRPSLSLDSINKCVAL